MLQNKRVGLLGRILLLGLLIYMVCTLVSVRQQIAEAKDQVAILEEEVSEQLQYNTELSNAIENRDNPNFVEDIAREKLDIVSPNDRVFYITD